MMSLLDAYTRGINKMWAKNMKDADERGDDSLRLQTLADAMHMLRVAAVLVRPVAPFGAQMIAEYFNMPAAPFFDWANIFRQPAFFVERSGNEQGGAHTLKHLEPRTDFFCRHMSQC
jgi:methionyl-tRNA synthetase